MNFKVWDNKKGIFQDEEDFLIDGKGNLYKLNKCITKEVYGVEPDRYEIFYSTGEIDKNGNEIYQGDIVEYEDYNFITEEHEMYVKEVIFDNNGIRLGKFNFSKCTPVKIIGHIKTDAYLLEGDE